MISRFTSLQARLSAISAALFIMMAAFGGVTIDLFHQVNSLTDELRQVWLPSTRLLGDLNNASSDARTAEADILLALDPPGRAARQAEMRRLLNDVARFRTSYENLGHAGDERALYQDFAAKWQRYTGQLSQLVALADAGQHEQALQLYRTQTRAAYDAASTALGVLTDHTVEAARQASQRTAQAYQLAQWMIPLALLLAFAMLLAALIYIRHFVSRPLVAMAATMHRLAHNDTEIDLPERARADEIGEMSRAMQVFRANAVDLIQSQQGLAQQAAMLEQKLALEQQLRQMQRNFSLMVSHEFRTPLTLIDAHAQRLMSPNDQAEAGNVAERATRIRLAVQRMTHLMENMLTTGRIIDGQNPLFYHPIRFDLSALLHEVCSFHRETAPAAYINEKFLQNPFCIIGDRKLLFQAFSNLLSNAIKYSPEDVFVTITAAMAGAEARVVIEDRGIGILAEDMPRLFTRYHRGGNAQNFVGTGVGLYLVKTVVALHGGDVTVQSVPGQGACFTVLLPQAGA